MLQSYLNIILDKLEYYTNNTMWNILAIFPFEKMTPLPQDFRHFPIVGGAVSL